jgi:hypothetical protein
MSAALGHLIIAKEAEGKKVGKYGALADGVHTKFYPVVFESFGGLGKLGAEFFSDFIKASRAAHMPWVPKEVVFGITRACAVAVQRGNALMAARADRRALVQDA